MRENQDIFLCFSRTRQPQPDRYIGPRGPALPAPISLSFLASRTPLTPFRLESSFQPADEFRWTNPSSHFTYLKSPSCEAYAWCFSSTHRRGSFFRFVSYAISLDFLDGHGVCLLGQRTACAGNYTGEVASFCDLLA